MTKLFRYQKNGVRQIEKFAGRALLADEMGLGKAQPLTALVLTPSGYVQMGQVKRGDFVIGSDGAPTLVVGVFPQGEKLIYKVEFTDGTSTECCEDHLWEVNTPLRKWSGSPGRVLPLKDIKGDLRDSNGNLKHFIPMVAPVQFEGEVPLHPYLMGYLIANGGLSQNVPQVTIPDTETVHRLSKILPAGVEFKETGSGIDFRITKIGEHSSQPNPLTVILRDLNLTGCRSEDKFIPSAYLHTTIKNRKILLKGLMDGDGSVTKQSNHLEYATASEQLALDVAYLIRSLGGIVRIHHRKFPKFTYNGESKIGQPSWRLSIALPPEVKPFKLSRKASTFKPRVKYLPTKAICKVTPLNKVDCQCIKVAAENGLYVTNDFIITHNTIQALSWIDNYLDKRATVVIVCPSSIKWNWQKEALRHFNLRTEVLSGSTPSKRRLPLGKKYIINYDILYARRGKKRKGWVDLLVELEPDLVIVDECQYIKTMSSKRTKAVKQLCADAPHVIMISGTPLTNRPAELYPTLNILHPDEFKSFSSFGWRYCKPEFKPWGLEFKGASNIEELHEKLNSLCMIRRRKSDVLSELPPKVHNVIPVELKPADYKEYKRAEKEFIQWLLELSPHKAKKAAKAEYLVKRGYLLRLASSLKLNQTIDWIENMLEEIEDKLIFFGVHINFLTPIYEHFKHRAVMVNGSVSGEKRERAFESFIKCPKTKLLVGNINAAGVGWNGQVASHVAFGELPWTPGELSQATDRAHRIGQKNSVTCHYLVSKDTAEESLCEILQKKSKVLSNVMDGDDSNKFEIQELLERAILKRSSGRG